MNQSGMEASHLKIMYGGHTAVEDFSFSAPIGRITALIGPNGAGKTSIFNACNGLLRPAGGTVELKGTDVTHWTPARRARHGLGRTFQRMELCRAMTVTENVALGRECVAVGGNALRQVFSSPKERTTIGRVTAEAIERCGLADFAPRPVGTLSTGQCRLVELARVLAGGFELLLLDEPSSGLDDEETHEFGRILRSVVGDGEHGILIVEHDMALVMDVCDYVYVLDFGHCIFSGTPAETQASDVVRAAYLGESAAVDAAVGATELVS